MTTLTLKLQTASAASPAGIAGTREAVRRGPLSQRLELAAVLSLLGSSAAYALFTLCHLG